MSEYQSTGPLEFDFENGWLTIWFNQPEKRNALTDELTTALTQTLERVRNDKAVRGVTLRGRGGVFCAGGDLKSFQSINMAGGDEALEKVIAISKSGAAIFDAVNTLPQVVIVLVEGAAMAGGFGLACCADVVIVEAEARFAFTETAIGITPAQISPFVIQKLGLSTARRLMLTAARFKGADAQDIGFADFVGKDVSECEELERTIRGQVLKCAPGAVGAIKELIRDLPNLDRDAQVDAAAKNFASSLLSDEGREGIASFIEKRKPVWASGDGS